MITPKFRAIPVPASPNGFEFYPGDQPKVKEWIESIKGKEPHLWVTIRKIEHKQMRSIVQNNYYRGVVIKILSDFTGYEPDEMHEALKRKFLTYENVKGLPTILSTTQLKTHEFEEYLERIRRWAATDFGVYIPLPNEAESDNG